jgi:hypothetical protein
VKEDNGEEKGSKENCSSEESIGSCGFGNGIIF